MQLTTATLAVLAGAASALEYQDFTSNAGITYKVAIPEATAAPFDVAFQIVAPNSAGWAGIAWGGGMLNNPLTVAWPDRAAETVTISSRLAYGYSLPQPYAGATYVLGPETTVNATHWVLDAVCKGCSQWTGGSLDPSSSRAGFAWAYSSRGPQNAASNTSAFPYHDNKGGFSIDLAAAQSADFEEATAPAAE